MLLLRNSSEVRTWTDVRRAGADVGRIVHATAFRLSPSVMRPARALVLIVVSFVVVRQGSHEVEVGSLADTDVFTYTNLDPLVRQ